MRYLLALAALAPSTALACGGFFCNQQEPVNQNSEKIVFEVHEGKVDVHVQIEFEGDASEFAWIVPVAAVPDLFLSSEDLFTTISAVSQPYYLPRIEEAGDCSGSYDGYGGMFEDDFAGGADSAVPESAPDDGGVDIIATEQVGAYDTVTLQADSPEALLEWLQGNGYDIPADLVNGPLAPYVAGGSYFVALKMASNASTGTLAPLGMSYDGDTGSIPIQLTAVAATPDMRLEVHVFGEHRAVPSNYLHVWTNDLAIDWMGAFLYGAPRNEFEVITRAADEAGGHAFATQFSGDASVLDDAFKPDWAMDTEGLENFTDPFEYFFALQNRGFRGTNALLDVFRIHWPVPDSVDVPETAFYNCMDCYVDASELPFDPVAMTADLETFVVEPAEKVEQMVERSNKWTRMMSSVSPEEMTLDPQFVLNDSMPDVSREHTATVRLECGEGSERNDAPRNVILPDGRSMLVPSESAVSSEDYNDWINALDLPRAVVVARTSDQGDPVILRDDSDFEPVTGVEMPWRRTSSPDANCGGCTTGGSFGWLALTPLLALRRRR